MRAHLLKGVAAAAILAAFSAAPAMAADLPVAAPAEPAFVPAEVTTWSGFYVGIQGGYAFESDDEDNENLFGDDENFSFFSGDDENEDGGFIVGGTVGYNFQAGNFVFGVEGDASYADFGDRNFGFDVEDDLGPIGTADIGIETNFFATARGRIGYAFDRFMIFATGGAAFVNLEVDSSFDSDVVDFDDSDDSESDFLFGYTVGGGVEAMITDNISAKIEYLYVSFDEEEIDLEIGDTTFSGEVTSDFHVIRGGLNFKFNSLFGG